MKINHDVKVRRAGQTITVWCKTHDEVLFTHQGRSDVPLAEVLEAVADHRGTPHRTAGHCRLRRDPSGAYRFDMDDVDMSTVLVGGRDFRIERHETGEKFLTVTIAIDSIDFRREDVALRGSGGGAGADGKQVWEYRLHPLDPPAAT